MVVVPLQKSANTSANVPAPEPLAQENDATNDATNWVRVAAGGSLLVGGFLLLTGRRRAGLMAATSGATLALLDQQEALRSWWTLVPTYIDQVQRLLTQVQSGVEDVAVKREKLRKILGK